MATPVNDPLQPLPQNGLATYQPPAVRPRRNTLPTSGYSTSVTPYTATNNLRSQQIAPTGTPQTIGQSATGPAMDAYGRARSAIRPSSEASGARSMAYGDLQSLGGPDRAALAESTFNRLRESTAPAFQKDLQGVGQRAAALGRLGAGMTTSDLGDVVQRREEFLGREQGRLADEAAGLTLSDRLGVFDARLRGSGQFTSEDLSRGEAERGLGMTLEDSARRDRAESVDERERMFGFGERQRGELRGERDFQNNMQQQAIDDYIRQRTLEEMLLQGEWDRNQDYTSMLLGYGYGG
jgi:hypothetical protein